MDTTAAARTFTTESLTAVKAGDSIKLGDRPARTVATITWGWSGNHRNAQRRIRIAYTDGTGSVFTSAMCLVTVTR